MIGAAAARRLTARTRAGAGRGRGGRRRGEDAQAVLETALVIPLLLLLTGGFLGLMLQVEAQQQLDSAVKLAAESTFQAPRSLTDPPPAPPCPPPSAQPATGPCGRDEGLPARCRFAWQTFDGSMPIASGPGADNFDHPSVHDPAHRGSAFVELSRGPLCVASAGGRPVAAQSLPGWPQDADIRCDIDADNRRRTVCDAAARLHFDRTPLAWAVVWTPTIRSHAEAVAPPFRQ